MDLGPKGWGSQMGEMISGSSKRTTGKEDECIEKGPGVAGAMSQIEIVHKGGVSTRALCR